jgi:gas vesicle protein
MDRLSHEAHRAQEAMEHIGEAARHGLNVKYGAEELIDKAKHMGDGARQMADQVADTAKSVGERGMGTGEDLKDKAHDLAEKGMGMAGEIKDAAVNQAEKMRDKAAQALGMDAAPDGHPANRVRTQRHGVPACLPWLIGALANPIWPLAEESGAAGSRVKEVYEAFKVAAQEWRETLGVGGGGGHPSQEVCGQMVNCSRRLRCLFQHTFAKVSKCTSAWLLWFSACRR